MPTGGVYAVDLHAHSRFFHGFGPRATAYDPLGVRLLAAVAARRDLDAVALTNHDYAYRRDGETRAPSPGEQFPTLSRSGVAFLPGIEVSTTHGHLLVVGPDPPRSTQPGSLSPTEAVGLAHDRGCAVVLPHPFRNSVVRESDAPVDAVELNGKTGVDHDAARALAADRDLPMVGGSDAHYPFEVGRAFTRVDVAELTPRAVVDAIRAGRVQPVVNPDLLQRGLEPVYRLIHWGKAHTGTGRRSEGSG